MRAGLRMNVMANPGCDKSTSNWSLAVSAINGCGMCMDSHEKTLREARRDAQGDPERGAHRRRVHAVAVTAGAGRAAGLNGLNAPRRSPLSAAG